MPAINFYLLPLLLLLIISNRSSAVTFELPSILGPENVGIVINDLDPMSVVVGEYYRQQRAIPTRNVFHIKLPIGPSISKAEFFGAKTTVDLRASREIQVLALTWNAPYRVECMSITTAFAMGFDPRFCSTPCNPTMASPYFASTSRRPHDDLGIRPAMMLTAKTLEDAKQLINRGIAADGAYPFGSAYLLNTSDKARSVRIGFFSRAPQAARGRVQVKVVNADFIEDKKDVLFYFTGAERVKKLDSLTFLDGAMADHLTSAGGQLTDSFQMSALRWIEAGVTASYGTVAEPCAFTQKFPNPLIAMDRYLSGETLIEAYWKSVQWPGEGIFVGEPLASPFREVERPSR